MKPIVRRAKADDDVEQAIEYYLLTAPEVVLAFADSLQQAYEEIRKFPASGSQRYALELNLPGLRFWRCKTFPYLVFYTEFPARVEVWRVLHAHRDISASLGDAE